MMDYEGRLLKRMEDRITQVEFEITDKNCVLQNCMFIISLIKYLIATP